MGYTAGDVMSRDVSCVAGDMDRRALTRLFREAGATKPEASPRWVTGTPANAGAAIALDTPGTISTSMPAARSASISSPPRPNTNGSPHFNLTT